MDPSLSWRNGRANEISWVMGEHLSTCSHAELVRSRLGPAVLATRVSRAREREAVLLRVANRAEGVTERNSVGLDPTRLNWSTYCGSKRRYLVSKLDGLIDARVPWPGKVTAEIREKMVAARRWKPSIGVKEIEQGVLVDNGVTLGDSTVKRALRKAGVNRPRGGVAGRGRKQRKKAVGEDVAMRGIDANGTGGQVSIDGSEEREPPQRLELAGMKVVEAGARKTGLLRELTAGIVEGVAALPVGENDAGPDVAGRDAHGRFLPAYNERYKKGEQDLGPGFAGVATKRSTKDPRRYKIAQVRPEVIERKVFGLMSLPVFTSHGLEALRAPSGEWLEEVCGYPYMPETFDKTLRELKFTGIGGALWERVAALILAQQKEWNGATTATIVFYIDSTAKPLWTGKFTKAGKVTSNGRVMPCLQAVMVHTGVGVPVYMETFSGRAGLLEHAERILEKLETMLGAKVSRIVVMDAEADCAPFLKRLEGDNRPWVTVLKGNILKGKEVIGRKVVGAYRDGDMVSEGDLDLPLGKGGKDGVYRVRVIEVTHRGTGKVTTVATCLKREDWEGRKVADLYYDRWPCQEGNIRELKQGTGFERIRGYGKEWVTNVAVVTELEKVDERLAVAQSKQQQAAAARTTQAPRLSESMRDQKEVAARAKQLGARIKRQARTNRTSPKYIKMLEQRIELDGQRCRQDRELVASTRKATALEERAKRASDTVRELTAKRAELDGQRYIYRNDTELDSLSSLLKVSFAFVIEWVLRTVFGGATMDYRTFIERVATLKGWYHQTMMADYVVFDRNERDPEIMALLRKGVDKLNGLKLTSTSGLPLRFLIDSG